jgi:hypothetical protein
MTEFVTRMTNHLSYDVLNRMVERRVSADEEVWAERHLARCGVCRSEREWLERIRVYPKPFPSMPPLISTN